MNAMFGCAGSISMPLTNRDGCDDVSMRKKLTVLGFAASALEATKTRPRRVPTQSVPLSLGARSVATTYPAVSLSLPQNFPSPSAFCLPAAKRTQSPQVTFAGKSPLTSLQCASSVAWLPPLSFVRQTKSSPANIVPFIFGSKIIGMYNDCGSTSNSGSAITSHHTSLEPWKFTSGDASKKLWKRMFALNALIPDWPPSPKMVTNQLPLLKACVPLSCVPPSRSCSGFAGLSDRLWYWSVPSPSFSEVIEVGIFSSHWRQSVRSAPVRPRELHWTAAFVKVPFRRQMPPSFALKTMSGLN